MDATKIEIIIKVNDKDIKISLSDAKELYQRIVKEIKFCDIQKYISNGVSGSNGVNRSNGVSGSNGVNRSYGVSGSDGVNMSYGVSGSYGVNGSNGVSGSNGVNRSYGVSGSDGVSGSYGVNGSYGVSGSDGITKGIFVSNIQTQPLLFNKKISEQRFSDIHITLTSLLNGWTPTFNNLKCLYLKAGSKWEKTPITNAEEISKEEAWKDMPIAAIEYLKSLPEFDWAIFTEITGIKEHENENSN